METMNKNRRKFTTILAFILVSSLITACGGGGGGGTPAPNVPNVPNPPATKNVNLTWVAPSTYNDGSNLPLSAIDGYRIYTGTSISNLSLKADIQDSTAVSYALSNLPLNITYVAISTYDVNGLESGLSTPIAI